jgi:hypothetical protein
MERVIRETFLQANSAKQAYYKLITEKITDGFLVKKESGIGEGKVLHREAYFRNSFEEAQKLHDRKIKEKTTANFGKKRVYKIIFERKS